MQHREERLRYLWKVFQEELATPAEARELLDYLASRPPETLETFLADLDSTYTPDPHWQPPIPVKTMQQLALTAAAEKRSRYISRLFYSTGIAAALLLAVAGIYHFSYRHRATPAVQTFEAFAKPVKYTLPDGSTIKLMPHSKLVYEQTAAFRQLSFTGKAWFDIVKDATHPCLIQSNGITTEVLGTSFIIDAGALSKEVSVAVESGAVNVIQHNQLLATLTSNQQLVVPLTNKKSYVKAIQVAQRLQWLGEDTFIDSRRYDEVKDMLEKNFGVEFFFETDQAAAEPVHTQLEADDSLEDILSAIAEVTDTGYEIKGQKVRIYTKNN